jgi:hypothetical protein
MPRMRSKASEIIRTVSGGGTPFEEPQLSERRLTTSGEARVAIAALAWIHRGGRLVSA